MFAAILKSKELNIIDRPKLVKKSFLVGDFKNKNNKLKEEVIRKLLRYVKILFPEQYNSV
jgi:hypothetical protein